MIIYNVFLNYTHTSDYFQFPGLATKIKQDKVKGVGGSLWKVTEALSLRKLP